MTRWLGVILVFACSSPRREAAPVVGSGSGSGGAPAAPVPSIDAASAVITPDADPFIGYPARIERPSGCTLDTDEWREQTYALAFVPDGKPFADMVQVKHAEVTLGAAAFADFTTASARLTGFLDKRQLHIYAAKPFLVAGYAAPGPKLPLRFVSASEDKVAFELPLPNFAKAKGAPRGERPCDDFAVDDLTDFDPRVAIAFDTQSDAMLHGKRAVPLSLEPGGPPVVTLRYDADPSVDVLETKGKHTRVAIQISSLNPAEHVILFGWVPSSAVHTGATGHGGSWGSGGPRSPGRGRPLRGAKRVACASEVPLVVEVGTERRTVGVVLANAIVEYVPASDELVAVRFDKPPAELAEGARWLVKQAALETCAIAP